MGSPAENPFTALTIVVAPAILTNASSLLCFGTANRHLLADNIVASIRAIYKDGVFKPLEDVPVKEGTEVDVYPRSEQPGQRNKSKRPWKSVKESPA